MANRLVYRLLHPALHVRGTTGSGYFLLIGAHQLMAGWFFLVLTGLALLGFFGEALMNTVGNSI